jgi:hypothetical protein
LLRQRAIAVGLLMPHANGEKEVDGVIESLMAL